MMATTASNSNLMFADFEQKEMMAITFIFSLLKGAAQFFRRSLTLFGILSPAQYKAFDTVSGKNPFLPNRASMVGSKPLPSMPSYEPIQQLVIAKSGYDKISNWLL